MTVLRLKTQLACLIGGCLALQVQAGEVMLDIGLTREQVRIEALSLDDSTLVRAGVEVCNAYRQRFQIPLFYCQSQLHFRVDGRRHTPSGWESVVAASLRDEIATSAWLLQRLGTTRDALLALPLEVFIQEYPEHPERSSILKSWLASRATQLQQSLPLHPVDP